MRNQERLEVSLEAIRHLLSHLHGEVSALGTSYEEVLLVLQKLKGVAEVDDLTGLLRRKTFFQKWEALIEACRVAGESCGILMIDIDHFKQVNDTFGHPAGDELIRKVAALLRQYEAPDCIIGRFGGEEFVVAARATDAELTSLAELIRRGAERLEAMDASEKVPHTASSGTLKCTLSIGVASSTRTGYEAASLLRAADKALYGAKGRGRNRVEAA